MRRLGIVTTGRSDYGPLRPVIAQAEATQGIEPLIYATGDLVSDSFKATRRQIEADGHTIAALIDGKLGSDSPCGIAEAMAATTAGFARLFSREPPDILLILGDRYEAHAAGLAALPFRIPVAHVHGGEQSAGALDEALRHGLTKLSHLHFTACDTYAQRVIQLGEEPWRVIVSGAPSLDNLRDFEPLSDSEFADRFAFRPPEGFVLVTQHPTTLQAERTGDHIRALLGAIEDCGRPAVFTYPCADTAGKIILEAVSHFVAKRSDAWLVNSLGTLGYFSLATRAAAMVGNSSSGIIEAASFRLPVVNIGLRQDGRLRPANVIDVPQDRRAIAGAIDRATSPVFRNSLSSLVNPFGDGHAAERIVARLHSVELGERLLIKRFYDLPVPIQEVRQCG